MFIHTNIFITRKSLMKHCYLLLADVFEIFHNKCIKIYELDPAHFLSAPGLAWLVCLKKPKVESELLTDIDMLLIIEKDTRGGICHSIHQYARTNNKYIKKLKQRYRIIVLECKQFILMSNVSKITCRWF